MGMDWQIPELTALQVGSYCVMDQEYRDIEDFRTPFSTAGQQYFGCSLTHSMTMLMTVISAHHTSASSFPDSKLQKFVTVDCGTKAMYVTPGTQPRVTAVWRHGADGTMQRVNDASLLEKLRYDWAGFGDEHAKVFWPDGSDLLQLNDVLEVIVAHCDPTINLHDEIFALGQDENVSAVWPI